MASGPPSPASNRPLTAVFFGTPPLAAHILQALLGASDPLWRVAAVVTRPDRPRGRGLVSTPSEVAAIAARYGVPVLKPQRIRTMEFRAELGAFCPDLLVIAAYGRILPREVLEVARRLPINVHASLLPRYRGPSPIQGALLEGESVTGVTIMRVVEKLDAGPILLQRKLAIAADDTTATLSEKLAELGAHTLIEAMRLLACGQVAETPQDESRATYTELVTKQGARIDWRAPASRIERMIRAYDPWPVAHTLLGAEEIRIYRAAIVIEARHDSAAATAPGTIVAVGEDLRVQCGQGQLSLLEVQAAGRKRMSAADFARGRRLQAGASFKTPDPATPAERRPND